MRRPPGTSGIGFAASPRTAACACTSSPIARSTSRSSLRWSPTQSWQRLRPRSRPTSSKRRSGCLVWKWGRSTSSFPASPSPANRRQVGKRHQARELALKTLFQLEGAEDDTEEVLRYHAFEGAATPDVATFALQLVQGVIANRERLDPIPSGAAAHREIRAKGKGRGRITP